MAESVTSTAFAYLGWAFLPGYATSFLQTVYYRLTIPTGQRHPKPGDPLFFYHHRRIRILVLCLYLTYVVLQALYDIKIAGDFYTLLGVTPSATEREIKAKFRRLAARFHPDKVREHGTQSPLAELAFVELKLAQDTIIDPAKRFAYDRFGPVIVRTQQPGLKVIRDYVYAGFWAKLPEYLGNAVVLVVLNYIWLPKWGQFWRYYAIAAMAFLELYFLTHTWHPPAAFSRLAQTLQQSVPALLPDHLLPYQILDLARKLSFSLNIFISQLAPPSARSPVDQAQYGQQQIAHLSQTASRLDAEAENLLQLGLTPFRGDAGNIRTLRTGMKDGIITSAVRNSPDVRAAVYNAIDRRKRNSTTEA